MEDLDFEKFDILVERYLSHQMSEEEELAFKKELANSDELKQRAATIAMVIKAMKEVGAERDEKIIGELQNMWEDDFCEVAKIPMGKVASVVAMLATPEIEPPRRNLKYIKYAVAACLIGVAFFVGRNQYMTHQNLTSLGNVYCGLAYKDIGQNRGGDMLDVTNALDSLFININEGKDLKNTISQLEEINDDCLKKDLDSEYYEYRDYIAWNLAIGHLKSGHKKEALNYLKEIVERNQKYLDNDNIKKVQALIDEIEKM